MSTIIIDNDICFHGSLTKVLDIEENLEQQSKSALRRLFEWYPSEMYHPAVIVKIKKLGF